MWKILFCGILLLNLSCSSLSDTNFISRKLTNSNMLKCMSDFIAEHPDNSIYGLYFIRYTRDSSYFIFITHAPKKTVIYNNKPDDFIKIDNKFIIINYGLNNLQNYDSSKAVQMINKLEEEGMQFTSEDGLFSPSAIMIIISDGKCSVRETGFSLFDIPTSKVIEDTTGIHYYIPSVEELRDTNRSEDYTPNIEELQDTTDSEDYTPNSE